MKSGYNPSRIFSFDYAAAEDHMAAVFAKLSSTGTVMIEQIHHFPRGMGKSYGLYDMIDWTRYKFPRSTRNRHHKAKAQPNCGPRGNNPW